MSLTVPKLSMLRAGAPQSRNIVKLKPGRGIMDWTRLASGKRLASATLPFVDEAELSRHNTVNDCWILLFGVVYDVTVYLEYHPGGVDELMRAAGTDASDLFNEYHQWVNYRSMLSSCVVGPFKGSASKLRKPDTVVRRTSNIIATSPLASPLRVVGIKNCRLGPNGLIIDFVQEPPPLECVVVAATKNALRILLRPYASEKASLTFEGVELGKKFSVFRDERCIRVEFDEPFGGLDVHDVTIDLKPTPDYHAFEIVKVATINHNCKIYSLRAPASLLAPIPLGHHVTARLWKKANLLLRPFTPISSMTATTSGGSLDVLAKIYEDGIFTPVLGSLSEGDIVELSDPIGNRDIVRPAEKPTVLMFAAGTGLTPMVNIITHRFASINKDLATKLFLFNRHEKDIVDDSHFSFSFADERLSVTHVLSEPSEEWSGWRGRLNGEVMTELLDSTAAAADGAIAFVCGPLGFNELCNRLLLERNFPRDRVIVFQ